MLMHKEQAACTGPKYPYNCQRQIKSKNSDGSDEKVKARVENADILRSNNFQELPCNYK